MAKVLIIVGVVLIILVITFYVALSVCIIGPDEEGLAKARFTTTMAVLKILHSAVNQFKMDTGRYPTQEEGLMVIVEQPGDTTVGWEPSTSSTE